MTAVIFFMVVTLAIVLGTVSPVVRDYANARMLIQSKAAYFTGEAGIEDAYYRVKKGKQISSPEVTTLNGNSVSVTVTNVGNGQEEILANGTASSDQRNIDVLLFTGVGSDFNYGAQVGDGGLVMSNNSQVQGVGGVAGNVYSNGPIVGSNGAIITGSATVATTVALDNQAQSNVCNQDNFVGKTSPQIDYAQKFVANNTESLYKVSLYIKKTASNPSTTYVRIVSDVSGSPATSDLTNTTIDPTRVTTSYGWVDVAFPSPANLISGQTYWIVMDASQDSNKYYTWCSDSNNGYGNGVGKYKSNWSSGGSWTQITGDLNFQIYYGAGPGTISNTKINVDAYANTVTGSTVTGALYCQTGSSNNKACDTSRADPAPLTLPISQANIDQWKIDGAAGGVINGDCNVGSGCATTLGPKKIVGNLSATNGATLTITGTLYVTGNVNTSNNGTIKCDVSFGANSCVIIADGYIDVSNNGILLGSGQQGSYILMVSDIAGCNGGSGSGCATNYSGINIGNNTTGAIFFTSQSMINVSNNAQAKAVAGYKLNLDNNAIVQYEQGVANTNFSSGPSGGYNILSWKEVQ